MTTLRLYFIGLLLNVVAAAGALAAPRPALSPRLHFCGEVVPIEQETVSQKLATALMSSAGYARHLNGLKARSAPYFAVIEPILKKHRIPNDFKYLPLIESAWKADAVSSRGAVGYWQFMDDTAKEMGLSIEPGADERTDLRKSTEAACKYLRFLHRKLGSWTLVAAAYNGGIGMLQRKMVRAGHRDYYALTLNEETGHYLYRILAMKELFTNAGYYAGRAGYAPATNGVYYGEDPYEREREQARKMGWLHDDEPEPEGTPIEPLDRGTPPPGTEAAHMDSLLIELLKEQAATTTVFAGDVVAKLVKPGKAAVGQSWTFALTQNAQVGDVHLQAGDALYAVVDEVDARGYIYLRVTKAVAAATGETLPFTLQAMNPATGQAGVPLPKLPKPGWTVQWKIE